MFFTSATTVKCTLFLRDITTKPIPRLARSRLASLSNSVPRASAQRQTACLCLQPGRPAACLPVVVCGATAAARSTARIGIPRAALGIGECPGSATVASALRKPRIYLPPRRGHPSRDPAPDRASNGCCCCCSYIAGAVPSARSSSSDLTSERGVDEWCAVVRFPLVWR